MKTVVWTLVFAFCIGSPAFAAKMKRTSQSYPAVEGEESASVSTVAQTQVPAPAQMPTQGKAAPVISPPATPPPSAPPPVAARGIMSNYDAVPAEQIEPLAKRLKLVEAIMRLHGRAYDYRVITIHDLELILASLEPVPKKDTETKAGAAAGIAAPSQSDSASLVPAPSTPPSPDLGSETPKVEANDSGEESSDNGNAVPSPASP